MPEEKTKNQEKAEELDSDRQKEETTENQNSGRQEDRDKKTDIKKFLTFGGVLAALFAYGPERCANFFKEIFDFVSEKISDIVERFLTTAFDLGADARTALSRFLKRVVRASKKRIVKSLVVYFGLMTIGVALGSGVIIALAGIAVGLYFFILSFVLENIIAAAILADDWRKEITAELGQYSRAVFQKLGFKLETDGRVAVDRTKLKSKLKEVRFFALPLTAFAFWLALFPSWKFYGFAFVILVGILAITYLTYWKEWPTKIWQIYRWCSIAALVLAVVLFAGNGLMDYYLPATRKVLATEFRDDADNKWSKFFKNFWKEKKVRAKESKKTSQRPKTMVASVAPVKTRKEEPRPVVSGAASQRMAADEEDLESRAAWEVYQDMEKEEKEGIEKKSAVTDKIDQKDLKRKSLPLRVIQIPIRLPRWAE